MAWRGGPRTTPKPLAPAPDPEPPSADGLGDVVRDLLALALHHRWHGTHHSERGETECARLAGAYDDVAAIEPIVLGLMRGGA